MSKEKDTSYDDELSFEETADDGDELTSKDSIKKLRERLKKAEEERKEYLEGWQRAKADYVNAKREEDEERTKATARAKERIIHDLLPVLDSFELAFANKTAWEAVDKNWRIGVEYIFTKLRGVLEEHGVTQVGKVGERFDPRIHQSVESVETEDKNDDEKIVEVMQSGYTIGERVIRAARVKVGKFS